MLAAVVPADNVELMTRVKEPPDSIAQTLVSEDCDQHGGIDPPLLRLRKPPDKLLGLDDVLMRSY